tara:strand:- start:2863 stop:3687 length:825 start_codon:yes stop_codon:yes gene_type:complete
MLSHKEKKRAIKSIKTKGYFIFKSIIKKNDIDKYSEILFKQKSYGQASFYKKKIIDKSTKQVFNLQNKNKIFLNLIENKLMNEINRYFLNDRNYKSIDKKYPNYTLSQFVARSSGKEPCVVHMDDKCPSTSLNVNYLQWAVPLTDTNVKNGCTTLLEGSHKFGSQPLRKNLKNFKDVILKKGDIAVWDGRIWHGAKANKTDSDRWVIIVTFTRWFFKPHYDIARSFPKKFYKYLNVKLKIILGFASISKSSEKMGLVQRGDLKSANNFIINRKF